MIYSDTTIARMVAEGTLGIAPYYKDRLNPASYDVGLDRRVLVFKGRNTWWRRLLSALHLGPVHDVRDKPEMEALDIGPDGLVLWPGQGYLLSTAETFRIPPDLVAVLDGKSSLGRLFVKVHETAGYIDPGFKGHITLEVTAMMPVRVFAGMKIGQIRFHTLTEPVTNTYDKVGHYRDQRAAGPVESYYWAALREKPDPFAAVVLVPRSFGGETYFLAVTRPGCPQDWAAPGGKIDPGETSEKAAVREVAEETGVLAQNLTFLRKIEVSPGEHVCFYLAGAHEGQGQVREDGIDVKWVPYPTLEAASCTYAPVYRQLRPLLVSLGVLPPNSGPA